MSWRLKLRALRNRHLRRDLEDELASHIDLAAEALEADGWTPDAARREARRRFGSLNQITETTRELHVFTLLETLLQDARYGLRRLRHEPGFTLVALLTLGLVIGANGAMFSLMEALLLRPLPFDRPEQLVSLNNRTPQLERALISAPDLEDFAATRSFSAVGGWISQSVNFTGRDEPVRVIGAFVSASLLPMLGAQPSLGRLFTAEEARPGGARVCVLSYGVWQDRFGGDPQTVGRAVTLNGEPFTVIGILPQSFVMPLWPSDVWIPGPFYPNYSRERSRGSFLAIARLADGVTETQAQAEVSTMAARLAAQYPDSNRGREFRIEPLREQLVSRSRQIVVLLVTAVGGVLLIGCANVAGLMLTKAVGRKQEMALRASLGAGRGRLIRQLLTESLLLALGGGLLGVAIAAGGMSLMNAFWGDLLGTTVLALNPIVIGYLLLVSTGTGLLFGLAPAFFARRQAGATALRQRGTAGGDGRFRGLLVSAQVALALVLLIGAGLMVKGVTRLAGVDPGFDSERVLTLEYRVPRTKYRTGEQQAQFHHDVRARVSALPGVTSAALVRVLPFSGNSNSIEIALPDRPAPTPESPLVVSQSSATPGYFRTLGIPIFEGRDFTLADTASAAPVVIVSRTFASKFWPNARALGRQIRLPASGRLPAPSSTPTLSSSSSAAPPGAASSRAPEEMVAATIIGIVGNTKTSLAEPDRPQIYVPYAQHPFIFAALAVKTQGEPLAIANAVRSAIWSVDKDQPMWGIRTMQAVVDRSISARRQAVVLLIGFSALALLLAALGLYGVLAYAVSQRTAEFGLRMAIGATPREIVRLVLRKGLTLAIGGVGAGLAASLLLTRYLRAQVFDVSPYDPIVYVSLSLVLLLVASLAALLPAWRAMRVDPVIALRQQ